MLSDLDNSVLAIEDHVSGWLLGTGVLVSPMVLLTCAHLFGEYERENIGSGRKKLPSAIKVRFGSASLKPSHIKLSQSLDLCCLYFDVIPQGIPIQLARASRLQGIPVTALGFIPDKERSRRSVIPELEVIHDVQSEEYGYLQYAQVRGGLPIGFSGGPVLLRARNEWLMVGMLQLGNQASATSRFIGVDPIASFLREQGLCISVKCLPPQQTAKNKPVLPAASPAQIDNSIIINGRTSIGGSVSNQITYGDRSGSAQDFEDSSDEL